MSEPTSPLPRSGAPRCWPLAGMTKVQPTGRPTAWNPDEQSSSSEFETTREQWPTTRPGVQQLPLVFPETPASRPTPSSPTSSADRSPTTAQSSRAPADPDEAAAKAVDAMLMGAFMGLSAQFAHMARGVMK